MAARTVDRVKVAGRQLELTNLGKVMYPETDFTKGQVVDYYVRVAKAMLPHLKDRPLNLKRYPDGVDGPFFYQKECPAYRPAWMKRTADLWSDTKDAYTHHCMANDLPSLVWLVNAADLEIHTFLAKAQQPDRPTQIAFDFDPGTGADALDCSRVAFWTRDVLAELGLEAYPKVSGSKGVQLHVPLNTPATYDVTKPFARAVAERLAKEHPDAVTANMRKELRKGKVFVDWSQNDGHKSTVCAYSLRATPTPRVAAPVTWDELQDALDRDDVARLRFGPDEVIRRVQRKGDLMAKVQTQKQRLPTLT